MEVYFYLANESVDYAVECGLKLSEWSERELEIGGGFRKCIVALLHPKDDMDKFRSDKYSCLKLRVENRYCFTAERYLYIAGLNSPKLMSLYLKSIIPAENYVFGTYRMPEALVTTTVIGGSISVLNKKMDSPLLYANSEELYVNNLTEACREKYSDFNNNVLYFLLDRLSADTTRMEKTTDHSLQVTFFEDKRNGKLYTLKNPSEGISEWQI